jgi:hypothetical protein
MPAWQPAPEGLTPEERPTPACPRRRGHVPDRMARPPHYLQAPALTAAVQDVTTADGGALLQAVAGALPVLQPHWLGGAARVAVAAEADVQQAFATLA